MGQAEKRCWLDRLGQCQLDGSLVECYSETFKQVKARGSRKRVPLALFMLSVRPQRPIIALYAVRRERGAGQSIKRLCALLCGH